MRRNLCTAAPLTLTLAAALALVPATAIWAQNKQAVNKAIRKVDRQILNYSPEKARQQLEPVMEADDPRVDAAMGEILTLEGKHDEGVAKLKAAARKSDDPLIHLALGDALVAAKKRGPANSSFETAAKEAEKLLDKKPNDTDARFVLGVAQARLKKNEEAIANLTQALSEDAQNPRTPYELGMLKASQGDHQAAFDYLSQAIDRFSGYAYAYYYRAMAANQIGKKDVTVNDLDRFLALAPNAPEASKAQRILQAARG